MKSKGTRKRRKSQTGRRANSTKFWKVRAEHYNELNWVTHQSYLDAFVEVGKFKKTDTVLDVGTGTGVVARAISPLVAEVIGLDVSQDMLEQSNWRGNMYFIRRDVRDGFFAEGVFDKVTARMVFHHIMERTQGAMNECHRVLKKGGKMIFSEGVPPSPVVKNDYIKIFKLKEKRLTFMEDDLVSLMQKAGFRDIRTVILWLRRMSVKNWLNKSGLPKSTQEKIYRMHSHGSDEFKSVYNMLMADGDCLIDMKMAILVGRK